MNTAVDPHEVFYRQAMEKIEVAYLKAQSRGINDPVVVAMDLREPFAQSNADAEGKLKEVQEQIAEAERRGVEPIAVTGQTRDEAARLFCRVPNVAAVLPDASAQGEFTTLILAGGAVSLRETAIPE